LGGVLDINVRKPRNTTLDAAGITIDGEAPSEGVVGQKYVVAVAVSLEPRRVLPLSVDLDYPAT
jgi:hypothetical protein